MEKIVQYGLALPNVNNPMTLHTAVMLPRERKMKVAFNNSFSASNKLQEIDMTPLFNIGEDSK